MTSAFQSDAFQSSAFQAGISLDELVIVYTTYPASVSTGANVIIPETIFEIESFESLVSTGANILPDDVEVEIEAFDSIVASGGGAVVPDVIFEYETYESLISTGANVLIPHAEIIRTFHEPVITIGANIFIPHTEFNVVFGGNVFKVITVKFGGEPVPVEHMEDAQKLDADAYVDLFQLILSDGVTKLHLKKDHDVTWQGDDYEGTGIKIDGVGKYADDETSRPRLSIINPEGVYSALIDQGYIDKATVVRYRVLKEHIEQDVAIYRRQQWKVSRVATLTKAIVVLELRDMMDGQTFLTPGRMFIPPDFPAVSLS